MFVRFNLVISKVHNYFNGLIVSILAKECDLFPKSPKNMALLPRHGGFLKECRRTAMIIFQTKPRKHISSQSHCKHVFHFVEVIDFDNLN